ncbi:MAG: Mut7-C RNAse domain-containing protein [bacterium]
MEDSPLKLFCDEQLGKLARWLRILGQDTAYEKDIDDTEIISRSRREKRLILTRDRSLAEKAEGVEVYCLSENYPALQLQEFVRGFRDRVRIRMFTRCAICNGEIEEIEKSKVKDKVPPFVYETQEKFTRCPSCGRIYWKATHRDRIEHQLRELLGELYTEAETNGAPPGSRHQ